MRKAVVEDWDEFTAFLAAQPFCVWSAQKRHEIEKETHSGRGLSSGSPPPKDDNADLLAALSSMA